MNHWGKNDRNHEYQDSSDSASNPRPSGAHHDGLLPTVQFRQAYMRLKEIHCKKLGISSIHASQITSKFIAAN